MKEKLAVRMARSGGIGVSRAVELERVLVEILAEGLVRDGVVRIRGFGVLEVVERSGLVWDPRRRVRVVRRRRRVVKWRVSDGLGDLTQRHEGTKKSKCKKCKSKSIMTGKKLPS